MKKWIIVFLMPLISCTSQDDSAPPPAPELLGQWRLTEQYADPGDGSGDFRSVDSDKTIEFFEGGSYSVMGDLCGLHINSGDETQGTYVIKDSLDALSLNNYLLPRECNLTEDYKVFLRIEGPNLILSFPCIEGCAQKYRKR